MWNIDEKGFAMGVSGSCTVIKAKDNPTPFQIQPGNQAWMTVLKFISFNGASLEPFVIWKDAEQQLNWYDEQGSLPKG